VDFAALVSIIADRIQKAAQRPLVIDTAVPDDKFSRNEIQPRFSLTAAAPKTKPLLCRRLYCVQQPDPPQTFKTIAMASTLPSSHKSSIPASSTRPAASAPTGNSDRTPSHEARP
jgi:hypothetical protein